MSPDKVAIVGIPTSAGGRDPGLERAISALRDAGLADALRAAGAAVVEQPDVANFSFRSDPDHPQYRNGATAAAAAVAAADATARAVREGFALIIGGDCSIVAGTTMGVQRALNQPVGLAFLDADADLNTPETTPSGYLNGMALALALGRGPADFFPSTDAPPRVQPEHVALLGFRQLDHGERVALGALGLALPAAAARKLGMRATAALALDAIENADGPVLVHFDVDLLDPSDMPAKDTLTPGHGLSWDEASDLLTALLASRRVVALEVTEYNPDRDDGGVCASKLVDLLARAIARRFRH